MFVIYRLFCLCIIVFKFLCVCMMLGHDKKHARLSTFLFCFRGSKIFLLNWVDGMVIGEKHVNLHNLKIPSTSFSLVDSTSMYSIKNGTHTIMSIKKLDFHELNLKGNG